MEGDLSLSELIAQNSAQPSEHVLDAVIKRLQRVIAGVVSRTLRSYGITDGEIVKDLCQDTFVRILNPDFKLTERVRGRTDAEILALMRVTTAHLVVDALRGSRQMTTLDESSENYGSDNLELELKVLVREVDTVLRKLISPPNDVRDYRIFWFYHRYRMTAKEISGLPDIGLTVKGVESVVCRLTSAVKDAILSDKGISAKGTF